MSPDTVPLLAVRDLTVEFATDEGVLRPVDGISFELARGETLGIVGESGCGKTVTSLALLRLVPPPGRIVAGAVELGGRDLTALRESELRAIRGRDVAMIFQEPMTALNPVYTIGSQIAEVLRRHAGLSRRQARAHSIELLARVGIPSPVKRVDEYPHQLSGGMRQRVMIAMALSCNPRLLIADEPTTALDVTTQAQVLDQIIKLQEELGMAMLLITHDLGVIAETCSRSAVMYAGRIVESGLTSELFQRPHHPYTQGLLASVPRIRDQRQDVLPVIPGIVPDLLQLPAGCSFADRCSRATALCRRERPLLRPAAHGTAGATGDDGDGAFACHHPLEPLEETA